MKKIIAIALALLMVLGLCACDQQLSADIAGGGADEKLTVGILMPTKEQTIWSIQGERLVAGYQAAGYATEIEFAEDDSARQATQIENMISKGVDALVVVAVDGAALTDGSCHGRSHFSQHRVRGQNSDGTYDDIRSSGGDDHRIFSGCAHGGTGLQHGCGGDGIGADGSDLAAYFGFDHFFHKQLADVAALTVYNHDFHVSSSFSIGFKQYNTAQNEKQ